MCGFLLERVLLDKRSENIRQGFVERARLIGIVECGLLRSNAVRKLMADHIERYGEAVEQLAVSVAEHHLFAVPERIVVIDAEVDRRVQSQSSAVDRIATVHV